MGARPEAVISCIYAFAKRIPHLKRIHLLPSQVTLSYVSAVARATVAIVKGVEVSHTVINEVSLNEIVETVSKLIKEYRAGGLRVAVDVTTGRKSMSLALYKAAVDHGADLVLYLHLRCREFEGVLYPLIPKHCINLVALKGELP